MRDNSGIIPREMGVKNNGNFRCITSILNLEKQRNWSRAWLQTVNSSSKKVKNGKNFFYKRKMKKTIIHAILGVIEK